MHIYLLSNISSPKHKSKLKYHAMNSVSVTRNIVGRTSAHTKIFFSLWYTKHIIRVVGLTFFKFRLTARACVDRDSVPLKIEDWSFCII